MVGGALAAGTMIVNIVAKSHGGSFVQLFCLFCRKAASLSLGL
jgi:hypothetical protein